jgi:uncharacterized membrane protein
MYFAVTIMLFVRFDTFSGVDNLREYRAAEITLTQGWNTRGSIQRATAVESLPYLSCLGVTVFPGIFSVVSGMDLVTVFKFCLSAIVCLKPILVYLNVREVFGRRELAALSAILYSQLYFVFYSFNTRDSIATVFLLCALLVFFKLIRKQRKAFLPLLCMFIFGIVVSHYTIAYFSNIILLVFILTLYVASKLGKKGLNLLRINLRKPHVGAHLAGYACVFCVILSLAWFSFVPTSPFFQHLQSMAHSFTPSIPQPARGMQTGYIVQSPLGPLVENWFRFEVVLALVGFLFLAFAVKKSLRMLLWLSAGGLFFVGFLISFVPYAWSAFGEFTRVYRMGFPFLSVFIAFILIKLDKKSKGAVLILFLLLNLPMNMLLPIHYRYVLYHPEESVSPDLAVTQAYVTEAEFEMSKWIRNYVRTTTPISVDQRGYYSMYYTNNELYLCVDTLDFKSEYLVLHHFAIKYGLWVPYGMGVTQSNQTRSLIDSNNVIFNDGGGMLLKDV